MEELPIKRVVVFCDPDAPTAEERKSMFWHVTLIVCLIGAPALGFAAVSGTFNALFAYKLGADPMEKAAWVAASLLITLFVVGLPIAIEILRHPAPKLSQTTHRIWIACMIFSCLSALGFSAATREHNVGTAEQTIKTRSELEAALTRATAQLDRVPDHRPQGVLETQIESLKAANSVRLERTEDCKTIVYKRDREFCNKLAELNADYQAATEAERLEARIEELREQLSKLPEGSEIADPQADTISWLTLRIFGPESVRRGLSIFVALLIEMCAAFGMYIASRAVGVLMTRENAKPLIEPMPEVERLSVALPAPVQMDAEAAFLSWVERCVSIAKGARIRAGEAFTHYETWCAQNGLASMPYITFGRRMSDYVTRRGGKCLQSNGRVYLDVRVAGDEPKLLKGPDKHT